MRLEHRWWVVISGPEKWFPQFADRFRRADFEVGLATWTVAGRTESGWCLATGELNRCENLDQAKPVAHAETCVLSGLARMLWEGIPPVEADLLIQVSKGEFVLGAILAVPRIAIIQGRTPMGIEDYLLDSAGPVDVVRDTVITALRDPKVARALAIYGRELPNWGSLYKVYELLRSKWGDDGLCATGLVNQGELRRFRATANLPAVGGIDARHATKVGDAPSPMSVSEADAMIRTLLAFWISNDQVAEQAPKPV